MYSVLIQILTKIFNSYVLCKVFVKHTVNIAIHKIIILHKMPLCCIHVLHSVQRWSHIQTISLHCN